jgi:hypothetical protein
MTIIQNYLADINDITSIRITCKCGMSTSVPVKKAESLRLACPSCETGWFPGLENSQAISKFLSGLQALANLSKNPSALLQVEFPVSK